ncbi:hypothetical protein X777_12001 [Ooceraea biroi]|uniref:Uncharacterized protein n=1 Tax=Ooceraea biroi TaxID=2015173 RepID=A0A026X1M6_OOCBI|nr:hypothetical protein X777_12001 [Ooceraea biroi]
MSRLSRVLQCGGGRRKSIAIRIGDLGVAIVNQDEDDAIDGHRAWTFAKLMGVEKRYTSSRRDATSHCGWTVLLCAPFAELPNQQEYPVLARSGFA